MIWSFGWLQLHARGRLGVGGDRSPGAKVLGRVASLVCIGLGLLVGVLLVVD